MTADTDSLERQLLHDLQRLGDAITDDSFAEELYRGLANVRWRKPGSGEGHVAVSWRRAEEIVNELRAQAGQGALTLAQTGGEGEVSDRVGDRLGRHGWRSRPLDTSRHDDRHADSPSDPPPDRQAGNPELERAHQEADAERLRRLG